MSRQQKEGIEFTARIMLIRNIRNKCWIWDSRIRSALTNNNKKQCTNNCIANTWPTTFCPPHILYCFVFVLRYLSLSLSLLTPSFSCQPGIYDCFTCLQMHLPWPHLLCCVHILCVQIGCCRANEMSAKWKSTMLAYAPVCVCVFVCAAIQKCWYCSHDHC